MIVVMKPNASESNVNLVIKTIHEYGLKTHVSKGDETTIIGAVGDKSLLLEANLSLYPGVDKLVMITETYKLANRKMQDKETVVKIGDITIGGSELVVIAGPCAIESEKQLMECADIAVKNGAKVLRGGAYKPRTSPYSFQGLEIEGLKFMSQAKKETGLKVICEVTSQEAVYQAAKYIDILQIGARNMQNFELLKETGKANLPVLLKRGMSATIDEWLNAAEYIMSEGNLNVILCERGIRTFETATRNTLDLSAIPILKKKTHLPVIVDPSHGTGIRDLVLPMSKAAICAGADGLMIEVHPDPAHALSDGPQSLDPDDFKQFMHEIKSLAAYMEKTV